ncbi:MAG: RNA polymerase sigma factor [Woeseiaceae bacterium]|nr:RNA polymerase sigma factor [Woeseiaceae bacterium]
MTPNDANDASDVELVREFKAGNDAAFDQIVLRFQDRVYRLASVWLYDRQNAADASQEVFLRAYKGLRRFRFRALPFSWLYRCTRNVCSEFNRQRRSDSLDDEPADDSNRPHQVHEANDAARRVRELVRVLPQRQREVVILRVFEDLSVAETAAAMGCREGTVKALLHKATQRLKMNASNLGLKP